MVRRWILTALLGAALMLCTWDPLRKEPNLWEQMCGELSKTYPDVCEEVTEPTVVETAAVMFLPAYGFYMKREVYVFVGPPWALEAIARQFLMEPPPQESVIVHEMVHYALDWAKVDITKCESERLARVTASAITDVEMDKTWYRRYGCAAP